MLVAGKCNCRVLSERKGGRVGAGRLSLLVPGDARRVIWRGQARARHRQDACGRAISAQRCRCPALESSKGPGHALAPASDGDGPAAFSSRPASPRLRSTSFSSGQTQSSSPHPSVTCLLQPVCDQHPHSPHPPAALGLSVTD